MSGGNRRPKRGAHRPKVSSVLIGALAVVVLVVFFPSSANATSPSSIHNNAGAGTPADVMTNQLSPNPSISSGHSGLSIAHLSPYSHLTPAAGVHTAYAGGNRVLANEASLSASSPDITITFCLNPFGCNYQVCQIGSLLETANYWTPVVVVSAPYEGSASGTSSVSVYSGWTVEFAQSNSIESDTGSQATNSVTATNGATESLFQDDAWSAYSVYNQQIHVPFGGIEVPNPCVVSTIVQITSHGGVYPYEMAPAEQITNGIQSSFSLYNPATHVMESSIGGLSQMFGYQTNNDNFVGGCAPGGPYTSSVTDSTIASSSEGITVSGGYGSWTVQAGFAMYASTTSTASFTYNYPQNPNGNWFLDALNGQPGGSLAFSFATCPGAPTGLQVTQVTSGTVSLAWTNPTLGMPLTANSIYWGTSCSALTSSAKTSSPVTSFTVGLASSTSYCFAVTAWNSNGQGPESNTVMATTLGGGGGGCVAWGTLILTPSGYVPVQKLRPGSNVDEYNLATQTLFPGLFVSGNTTWVTQIVEVNDGWLRLTPTDQPLYIENNTFVGWLRDPQNLTTADSIFNPVTQNWVPVTSVELVLEHIIVFDVVTSGANNFIANGALLDIKKGP